MPVPVSFLFGAAAVAYPVPVRESPREPWRSILAYSHPYVKEEPVTVHPPTKGHSREVFHQPTGLVHPNVL